LLEEMECFSQYIEKYEKEMPEVVIQQEQANKEFRLTYEGLMKWNKREQEKDEDADTDRIF